MSTINRRILPHLPLCHRVKAQGSSQPRPAGGKRQQIGVLNLGFCSTFPTFASGLQQEIGHGLSVEELCLRANCRPKPFCLSIGHKVRPPRIGLLNQHVAPYGRPVWTNSDATPPATEDFRLRFGRRSFPKQETTPPSAYLGNQLISMLINIRHTLSPGVPVGKSFQKVLYPGINQVEVSPWSPERTISLLIRSSK